MKKVENVRNIDEVAPALRTPVASKQYGLEDALAPVIAKACVQALGDSKTLNVDNVRVAKILGKDIWAYWFGDLE